MLGADPPPTDRGARVTVTFAVGGAGAQTEIGVALAQSLRPGILDGRFRLALVAGVNPQVEQFFRETIARLGLEDALGHGVLIVREETKPAYFDRFNALMRETDVLWTKPSELSFYSALGHPDRDGAADRLARDEEHALAGRQGRGAAAVRAGDALEWLGDMLRDGVLAEKAFSGFVKNRKLGVYKIEEVLRTGTMVRETAPAAAVRAAGAACGILPRHARSRPARGVPRAAPGRRGARHAGLAARRAGLAAARLTAARGAGHGAAPPGRRAPAARGRRRARARRAVERRARQRVRAGRARPARASRPARRRPAAAGGDGPRHGPLREPRRGRRPGARARAARRVRAALPRDHARPRRRPREGRAARERGGPLRPRRPVALAGRRGAHPRAAQPGAGAVRAAAHDRAARRPRRRHRAAGRAVRRGGHAPRGPPHPRAPRRAGAPHRRGARRRAPPRDPRRRLQLAHLRPRHVAGAARRRAGAAVHAGGRAAPPAAAPGRGRRSASRCSTSWRGPGSRGTASTTASRRCGCASSGSRSCTRSSAPRPARRGGCSGRPSDAGGCGSTGSRGAAGAAAAATPCPDSTARAAPRTTRPSWRSSSNMERRLHAAATDPRRT